MTTLALYFLFIVGAGILQGIPLNAFMHNKSKPIYMHVIVQTLQSIYWIVIAIISLNIFGMLAVVIPMMLSTFYLMLVAIMFSKAETNGMHHSLNLHDIDSLTK